MSWKIHIKGQCLFGDRRPRASGSAEGLDQAARYGRIESLANHALNQLLRFAAAIQIADDPRFQFRREVDDDTHCADGRKPM